MANKHWIQGAIKSPGSFTKSAERAGESVSEFASEKKDAPGKIGKRAKLAIVLKGLRSAHK
jgi:hypothetical protein